VSIPRAAVAALFLLALACAGAPARAATSSLSKEEHGAARLITAVEGTGSDRHVHVGLELRLSPGWHTYWRSPGDAGVAPAIDWQGSENLADAVIDWPAPIRLPPVADLETVGYEDGVVLPISVTLQRPGEALRLHGEVDYAACKDVCIPYHASLNLAVPAGFAAPGPEAPLIAAARARVPRSLGNEQLLLLGATVDPRPGDAELSVRLASDATPLRAPDLFVEGIAGGSPGRPKVALSEDGHLATLRVPVRDLSAPASLAETPLRMTLVDGLRSAEFETTPLLGTRLPIADARPRLDVVGLALLGGLILNLMPCVLPVLSLKLLALVGHAGNDRRAARIGLVATAAGIIASFAVLAAVLIALKAAGAAIGWGIQFQQPWFLAAMALATTLFAASLWDWLPINLPVRIGSAVAAVRGGSRLADAFLLGAFATTLAASCSAPFVGTAIGFALGRGPFDIALIFIVLGLGMAAPFLAAAALPGVVAWLPRRGPWMGWLRRLLGLALLGTAAWLVWVLALEAGLRDALLIGLMLVLVLASLAWRNALPAGGLTRPLVGGAIIVLSAITVLVPALHGQAVPLNPSPPDRGDLWRPFDEAALRTLVANGNTVFVDVSAAWCLTCKANELAVLDRAPVAERLRDQGVIAMRADWTHPDPTITTFLQGFGRYGIPLNVVYGPRAPAGIALPELLTSGAVMDAFERAAARHRQEAIR
jgi:suppressor for copper-sensitivity B